MNLYRKIISSVYACIVGVSVVGMPLCAEAFVVTGTKRTIETFSHTQGTVEYIPLLSVCDAFGVSYDWDAITNKVRLYNQGSLLTLLLHEPLADVNGTISLLAAAPEMINGNVMVPASIISLPWWGKRSEQPDRVPVKETPFIVDTIILDPGHGGHDAGATGRRGTKEKFLVLDLAKRMKGELEQHGMRVLLTRDRDYFVTLQDRSQMANATEADLFISVHANSNRSSNPYGFEVYALSEAIDDHARALEMMENALFQSEVACLFPPQYRLEPTLWDLLLTENKRESYTLAGSINKAVKGHNVGNSRGVKKARFYVLKWTNKPAVLLEVGFISNPMEERKLNDSNYQNSLVRAIVDGVLDYKRQFEETKGYTL